MSGSRMLGCLLVLVCAGPAVADETPVKSSSRESHGYC